MRTISLRWALYALWACLSLPATGFAQTFQHNTYSSPNGPTDLFAADLNHDGKDDIVAVQSSSTMVTVFLNHGNGTFTSGGSATYVVGNFPHRVLIADLNGDGNPDIATANCDSTQDNPNANISVLLGRGDGTFENHVDYAIPACPTGFGSIRVAGDKQLSLLVSTDGPDITLLRNDGTGTFILQTVTGDPSAVLTGGSAGDYNRDGSQDIAALMSIPNAPQQVVVFYGNAAGGFSGPNTIQTLQSQQQGFDVNTVDFTDEGIGDLLVPHITAPTNAGGLLALANNGSTGAASFTAVDLSVDANHFFPGFMAAEADFNNDGFHELLLPVLGFDTTPSAIAMFPGTSKESWGPAIYLPLAQGAGTQAVVFGHFQGSNLPDFATVTADSVLHVFLNISQPAPCAIPSAPGVAICSPNQGTKVVSPIFISSSANGGSNAISAMKAYLDGHLAAQSSGSMLQAAVPAGLGSHQITVNAWDVKGKLYQTVIAFTVRGR